MDNISETNITRITKLGPQVVCGKTPSDLENVENGLVLIFLYMDVWHDALDLGSRSLVDLELAEKWTRTLCTV